MSELALYAVAKGRSIGLFLTWSETKPLVDRFSGAIHKKFSSLTEAVEYLFLKNKKTYNLIRDGKLHWPQINEPGFYLFSTHHNELYKVLKECDSRTLDCESIQTLESNMISVHEKNSILRYFK